MSSYVASDGCTISSSVAAATSLPDRSVLRHTHPSRHSRTHPANIKHGSSELQKVYNRNLYDEDICTITESAVYHILTRYHIWKIRELLLQQRFAEKERRRPPSSPQITSHASQFRQPIPFPKPPYPPDKECSVQNLGPPRSICAIFIDKGKAVSTAHSPSVHRKNSSPRSQRKRPKAQSVDKDRTLACPFYMNHPAQYFKCASYKLSRIKDVKQHLTRIHKEPIHCGRCCMIFDDESTRDDHVRGPDSCEVKPKIDFGCITHSQTNMLSKYARKTRTIEQQWFDIYGIIFPGQLLPKSPYASDPWFEGARNYEMYLEKEGFQHLTEFLARKGYAIQRSYPALPAFDDGNVEKIYRDAFQILFDRWKKGNSVLDTPEVDGGYYPRQGSTNSIEQPPTVTPSAAGDSLPLETTIQGEHAGADALPQPGDPFHQGWSDTSFWDSAFEINGEALDDFLPLYNVEKV
ncbi:hypothetical protein F5Y03DRAFT_99599 [Xylaria venustula]|nr:hypothetical protein F5Y03DRAFT_99599 [Xylaria venustula]